MKSLTLKLLALGLLFVSHTNVAYSQTLTLERIPVDQVYIPAVVTSEEDAKMVISGFLPNLCYDAPEVEAKVQGKNIVIDLYALNSEYTDTMCAEMVRPVLEALNLGRLESGEYQILAGDFIVSRLVVE